MKTITINKIARVIKNRKRLEEELNIKITNAGKNVTINGSAEDEYIGAQVIDALEFGFPYGEAITMKKEGKLLETINIKEYTKKHDLERIRGRIIGKQGKAIRTLANLSNCKIEIKENTVAIIGEAENIKRAAEALIAIIQGAKHANAYRSLESTHPTPIYDLGLKDAPVKTMDEYEEALKEE